MRGLLLTTLTLVGLACGKRPFVPEQASSSSSGPSLVVEGIPNVDASAWPTFERVRKTVPCILVSNAVTLTWNGAAPR